MSNNRVGNRTKLPQGKRSLRRNPRAADRRQHHSAREAAAAESGGPSSEPLRLNKYLANAGVASRRKADKLIAAGLVRVNGKVIKELGSRVQSNDLVTVKGDPVNADQHLTYLLLNKPKDYITTTSDEKGRKTVMELLQTSNRLFPVGRLDRNTTGVLLITNDGDLAHRLMHPSYQVERLYRCGLDRKLLAEHALKIARGLDLEDGRTQPCEIIVDPKDGKKVTLCIREGRNREIRRMFESLGYDVRKLDRKMYGPLSTRGISRGDYRHLTRTEVRDLEQLVGLANRFGGTGNGSRSNKKSSPRTTRKNSV